MQDNHGDTALLCAAEKGHQEVCELLISRDCKVDFQHVADSTVLIAAAKHGHTIIVIFLIKAGCNISIKDN